MFQSGLQLDDEYPIVSPTQGIGVFSAVLSANRTILLSRDDSSWTSTTTYRFYTALQTGTISTNAATITMYFVRTDTKEL